MKTRSIHTWCHPVIKKTTLFSLFVVFFLGSALGQNWETGTLEEAQAKAEASGKFLLLDFFQEYG